MTRIAFTMLPANDLGLPSRLLPVARALAQRGHEVAMFNPAPAPSALIAQAGLRNLPVPGVVLPEPKNDLDAASQAFDVEHFFGALFSDVGFVRAATELHLSVFGSYSPDMVVDSFGPFACLAARIMRIPLVSVIQGNFHPMSPGFLWWQPERPANLPSARSAFNAVAVEHGLKPLARVADLMAGDFALIVGTPETDPVAQAANVIHVGALGWQGHDASLPDWVATLGQTRKLVWVYSGNPRYAGAAGVTPIDSVVVIRAAIAALQDADVDVVLTTGFQELPAEVILPKNFHHAPYLPGPAMAARCDLMVHHGGHGSVITSLAAGTPAVMIPTISERESNARRMESLGAGAVIRPTTGADGEKRIDHAAFAKAIHRVLNDKSYEEAARRLSTDLRELGGARAAADKIEMFAATRQNLA
jgi:UDP:flavonoid glycosyltransferase YjiC (YdhE family)